MEIEVLRRRRPATRRGIDVEHHRRFQGLARLKGLLGEAEAFELQEIGAGEVGLHVVGGDARASARRRRW